MRLKKAIKEYLELDSTVTDYFEYVFTFYNIVNVRRSNALFEHGSFPMITMNELDLTQEETHQDGAWLYSSILELQLDTLIDNEIGNDRELSNLNNTLLAHEDACEYVLDKISGLSLNNEQICVTSMFLGDCDDSQLIYNLYNNDHERIVVRKTMNFTTKYYKK